jgi:site-specific recombinase XerD
MHSYVKSNFIEYFKNNPHIGENDLVFNYNIAWLNNNMQKLRKRKIKDEYTHEEVCVLSKKLSSHSLRHTFATNFVKKESNANSVETLQKLQALLGHTTPSMSLRYVHTVNNDSTNILEGLTHHETKKIVEAKRKDIKDRFDAIISDRYMSDEELKANVKKLLQQLEEDEAA